MSMSDLFAGGTGPGGARLQEHEKDRMARYKAELTTSEGTPKYSRPFFLGPLWGSSDAVYEENILHNIINLERVTGMLTTREQREILGDIVSDALTKHDLGRPLATAFALFMTFRKRNPDGVYFPVVGRMKGVDQNVFPPASMRLFSNRIPALHGSRAKLIWRTLTFVSYAGAAQLVALPLWHIWQKAASSARLLSNPALKDLTQAAARNMAAERQRLVDERMSRMGHQRQGMATPQQRVQFGAQGAPNYTQRPPPEDLSSTPAPPPDAWAGSQYPESEVPHERQAASLTPQPQARRPAPAEPQSQQSPWDSSSGIDDSVGSAVFDDASPVAPSHRPQVTSSRGRQAPATTWDEIRQRSAQGQQGYQSQQAAGQPPPSGSGADAPQFGQEQYTYAESDKTKAQKEFDAMLEAERKGSGGSNWKRW